MGASPPPKQRADGHLQRVRQHVEGRGQAVTSGLPTQERAHVRQLERVSTLGTSNMF